MALLKYRISYAMSASKKIGGEISQLLFVSKAVIVDVWPPSAGADNVLSATLPERTSF
jgi:hypothetical protein